MKICPKCKRFEANAWQVCGTCKVDLIVYKRHIYRVIILRCCLGLVSLLALLPLASLGVLHACKQTAISLPLQNALRILSHPMLIAVGIFILCVDLYIFITTALSEGLSADELAKEKDRAPA